MKILLTADPELPVPPKLYGGIERIVDLLVVGLQARGHSVGLVAHRASTSHAHQRFAWKGLQSQNRWDTVQNTLSLWLAVQQFQPDIIHSFSRIFYLLPLLRSSVPKVMSYQRYPSPRTTALGLRLAHDSLSFTGCSDYICGLGSTVGGHWYTIHNGVEIEKYQFQPTVPADAPLVFLSRIERIKGAHTAIAIAQRTGRRLLIAGNYSTTGAEGQYWEQEILPYLNKDGIEYVGPVDDEQKNRLLGQAAAMLVPIEWNEPFGIVFAEALACGTPVISCPYGALPEIVRQGVDGFLVNTVEEACKAVQNLDQIHRHNCRDRAEKSFSTTVIIEQYEQLYERLVNSIKPSANL
jgi:glycosyltransferase involved in cell wall biosynthesis